MNESKTDFELLQKFFREGDQAAFATVVQRHLNLVYATSLRKTGEHGRAEEISQNVFSALARKAWQFASDDSLPAWLHRTTLLEAKSWLRGELRHRRREQTAMEMGTTMNTGENESLLGALIPILDESLLSLREKDRVALLLRCYEGQSLKQVGAALGIREDAAQKRVAAALESLAQIFQRRGFKSATMAISATLLQHTASAAPAAFAASIAQMALQISPPVVGGLLGFFSRLASLSSAQTTVLCLALVSGPVLWEWNDLRVSKQNAMQVQLALADAKSRYEQMLVENQEALAASERLAAIRLTLNETKSQTDEAAEKLAVWRSRIHTILNDPDYKWPDDFPFVRLSKSALKKVAISTPLSPTGEVLPFAREVFGLTESERKQIEQSVQGHIARVDGMIDERMFETNRMMGRVLPEDAVASKILFVPPLGDEAKQHNENLRTGLKQQLGEERWPIFEQRLRAWGTEKNLRSILNLDSDGQGQQVAAWITYKDGNPFVWYEFSGSGGALRTGVLLSAFDPVNSQEIILLNRLPQQSIATPVVNRIQNWLQREAIARRPEKATP